MSLSLESPLLPRKASTDVLFPYDTSRSDFAYLSPEGTLRVTGNVALFTRFPDAECCIM